MDFSVVAGGARKAEEVICSHCGSMTNVSQFNGASLRCACGKTTAPGSLAADGFAHAALPELLALMRTHKALRLKTPLYEVELSPDAFAPSWSASMSTTGTPSEPLCRCGHSLPVAHNPEGLCLEGCAADDCAEKAEAA